MTLLNDETTLSKRKKSKRAVTLSDVAKQAGVTRWVAGQILNNGQGNSRCSEETKRRIYQVAKELNYRVNVAAQYLQGKRSRALGLMVASAGDPLNSFLVEYLDIEAVKNHCQTIISNTIGDASYIPNRFEYCVDELASRGVDGVFCAVHRWWSGDRGYLLKIHPNTVFYENPGIANATYVTVDRHHAMKTAVERFADQGRRRIGIALASTSYPTHRERLEGYKAGLKHHSIPFRSELVFDGSFSKISYASFNHRTKTWNFPDVLIDRLIEQLVDERKSDAIIAHNDYWAASILRKLLSRGIRVPDDIAVIGYFNHYLADWTTPSLTTIDVSHDLAARHMVDLMEKTIEGGLLPPEQRIRQIKPTLVIRQSG